MKTYSIGHYLRQNKSGKKGQSGSYSLRLLWVTNHNTKSRRVEIGLNTTDYEEALKRASVFLNGIYTLGGKFSNKIHIGSYKCDSVPLIDVITSKKDKIKQPSEDLPLFKFSMQFLPPATKVDNQPKQP